MPDPERPSLSSSDPSGTPDQAIPRQGGDSDSDLSKVDAPPPVAEQPAAPPPLPQGRSTTLARQATGRIAALLGVCLGLMCLGGYLYVFQAGRTAALDRLREVLDQQLQIEAPVFEHARANADVFRDAFLALYRDAPPVTEADFATWFTRDAEGAWRTLRSHYTGTWETDGSWHQAVSGFVSNVEQTITPDHQRRLVIALRLLARLGPAWSRDYVNTTVSTPENGLLIYWPGIPWGLQARADLETSAGSVIRATFPEQNPDRTDVWTSLYHDHTAQQWMVTYQRPVDDETGRHLINIGHDVPLDALLERLKGGALPGADRLLLDPRGRLIAWPGPRGLLDEEGGEIELSALGDAALIRRHRLLQEARDRDPSAGLWLVEDREGKAWVGAVALPGPGWWYVVVYPQALVTGPAHKAASQVVVFGGVLALLMVFGISGVMDRRVGQPLQALARAAEAVGAGRHGVVAGGWPRLPDSARNEIGLLARTIRATAAQVHHHNQILEREIANRTRDLEIANRRLLALSETDALTGLGNRRALDADLIAAQSRRQEDGPIALILCDIDHFKAFNDTQGHPAGDEVLRQVADRLLATVRPGDKVYRYGGEEIAVLLFRGTEKAEAVARRIVGEVARLDIAHPASPHGRVTISAGLAWEQAPGLVPRDLIARADACLYRAKDGGRNRLVVDAAGRPDGTEEGGARKNGGGGSVDSSA